MLSVINARYAMNIVVNVQGLQIKNARHVIPTIISARIIHLVYLNAPPVIIKHIINVCIAELDVMFVNKHHNAFNVQKVFI